MASSKQANSLDYLDSIGTSKENVVAVFDLVEETVFKTIADAQRTLDKKGKVSTGSIKDIVFTIEESGKNATIITIGYKNDAKEYYDYIDKGVNGTVKSYGAPYSYKNNKVGAAMVNSIRKWVKTNKIASKSEDQKNGLSSLQKKRKTLKEVEEQQAYGIAVAVKKKGHKPTHFLSGAIKKNFGSKFRSDFAKKYSKVIAVNISNGYNNK